MSVECSSVLFINCEHNVDFCLLQHVQVESINMFIIFKIIKKLLLLLYIIFNGSYSMT